MISPEELAETYHAALKRALKTDRFIASCYDHLAVPADHTIEQYLAHMERFPDCRVCYRVLQDAEDA